MTVNADDEAQYRHALQCYGQGRYDEAFAICEHLTPIPALQGGACLVMGCIHLLRQQAKAAERVLRIAVQKLNSADAWFNLALALAATNKPKEAEEAYRKTLQLDPNQPQAWNNLGNLMLHHGYNSEELQQALACYRRAIELRPGYAYAHTNLGFAYNLIGQQEKAERHYRKAWELEPGKITRMADFIVQRRRLADWSDTGGPQPADLVAIIKNGQSEAITPLPLLAWPEASPDLLRDAAARFARSQWGQELGLPPLVNQVADVRGRRIRVGYLSADFRNHPVTHLITEVIAHHDRDHFEVFLYAYGPEEENKERQRLRRLAEHFNSVSTLSDEAIAERIRADGIDLLVDLTGHTLHARLGITARRPAALIVSWLGYTGSLGEPRLADYIIGDPIATPPEHAAHFSETLALMPHCYMPHPALAAAMPLPKRQAENLPEDAFVFCSFNQCFKLTPTLWDDWCRILSVTGNSILWLASMNPTARDNLRREAAQRGIEPQRLVFAERRTLLSEHQARLALADLALDTWPYNSCATASDALRAGVPLLTLNGSTFIGRVGASLLHTLGLDELIAKDRAAYIDLAVALATDKPRRQALRTTLATHLQTSPLFDPKRFSHDLERLFQAMLEQRAHGTSGVVTICPPCTKENHLAQTGQRKDESPEKMANQLYADGIALYQKGKFAEADKVFAQLLISEPKRAEAWNMRGVCQISMNRFNEAEIFIRQALTLRQDSAYYNNLASTLSHGQKTAETIAAYRQSLALNPNNAKACFNLGGALTIQRPEEALALYRKAWELEPKQILYMASFIARRRDSADWSDTGGPQPADLVAAIKNDTSGVFPPLPLLAWPEASPDLLRATAASFAQSEWRYELSSPPLVSRVADVRGRRIRIGYLSADFRNHPVSHLITEVIAHHDRDHFEVFLYAYGPEVEDEERQRLRRVAEHFISVSALSDGAAAEKIRDEGIDLLVDLTGYTTHARLGITARRPAAVIASWLGYTGTLGEPRLADYIIGDPIATPPERAGDFSETLALMPHCYMPNPALTAAMPVPKRQAENLPESAFVFCSFNQCFKLTPMLWDDWCRILANTPNSTLWLPQMPAAASDNLRREAERRSVDPQRLVFAERRTLLPEHLARLALADLALDTWPYNSCATASDALRAGVPLLTLSGDTFIGRVGASLLHTLGLDELIAEDRAAYIDLAVALATDKPRLQALRTALAARLPSSPLFDPLRFSRDLEHLFQAMLEQRARGTSEMITICPAGTKENHLARTGQQKDENIERANQLYVDGTALYQKGKFAEADKVFAQLLTSVPNNADAWHMRGVSNMSMNRLGKAEVFLRQALKLRRDAIFYANLGITLKAAEKIDAAIAAYRESLALNPDNAQICFNLGNLLMSKRPEETLALYRKAHELEPDQTIYMASFVAQRRYLADWPDEGGAQPADLITAIKNDRNGSFQLLPLLACPEASADFLRDAAARFAQARWHDELSLPPLVSQVADVRGRRIRVGYLSVDFHNHKHPVTYLITDVIAHHDRSRFEVFLYAYGPEKEDKGQQALRQVAEHFISVSTLSDLAAAEKIRADGIDLLVDLTGYTAHARLGITARRPAAVIASWLGYTGSLGEPRLADYIIGDAIATPPERAGDFSESLALMPHCYLPNPALATAAMLMPKRQAENLPEDAFVFCSFNQCYKLTPILWDDWCRILLTSEKSILWLPPIGPTASDNLRREAERRGIDPRRLLFAQWRASLAEHQARLALADLALDPWPYNSCATACDALRAGVPLLTLNGDTFIGRVGASLLHTLGLDELIAKDRAAYIDLAVTLANDKPRLQALKATLASRLHSSPLFDPLRFSRDLERLFQAMLNQRMRGETGIVRT